jgi:hypothetical protein
MTERLPSTAWAAAALRYLDAFDAGDLDALYSLWKQAATNPELEQVLGELTDGLALEEGPDPSWESDAARVRTLLREHLPSAFVEDTELPPLTVGDVAARLRTDQSLASRLSATDWEANDRLRMMTALLPEELGLPNFEKWQTTLGVQASSHYWRAFRQAAVLLAMGRCQRAGELAAARRAGRTPRGGRP